MRISQHRKKEYGDFQTPWEFTCKICELLYQKGVRPKSIIEPTCGQGNFFMAAMEWFNCAEIGLGYDINDRYIQHLKNQVYNQPYADRIKVVKANFFNMDWKRITTQLPEPILFIGNPPWVTNSFLGSLESENIPKKKNSDQDKGLDALTGKSNFDISEWMWRYILDSLEKKSGWVALLTKTVVARKIIQYGHKSQLPILRSELYLCDTKKHFNATVNAGLLLCYIGPGISSYSCSVYQGIKNPVNQSNFGVYEGQLIANLEYLKTWKHLQGQNIYQWRSGIKHDCSKIMELTGKFPHLKNGLGEALNLERFYLYPLLKSSDIAHQKKQEISRYLLVTQSKVGAETDSIAIHAPLTWHYLTEYKELFERRKSSIYRGKPSFSIFGVGDYSFSPWKVAISGLYKKISFCRISAHEGKPVMLDDTCYFIACKTESEAVLLEQLLNSQIAQEFFSAFIFWDAKRPITASILNRLDLFKLADELGKGEELRGYNHCPDVSSIIKK
ncbi:hypothetical protein [Roseofilum sp. Guam]|uniref:hypothetical protein n=1 Tax=Roseofilum sp. Guam TaxID=2821502 RepID=UPI001B12AA18|nr:hypothetical protein [Roseofilum sp. Guam]MBP0028022.1 SAM-dependent methyltransferase [Roseofilum sp. Guam]